MTSEQSEPSPRGAHRRIAVVPVAVGVFALLGFAVALTVVITLASTSSSPDVASSPRATSSPSAEPGHSSTPAAEATAIPPTAQSSGSYCIDYTAEVSSLDIESARVAQSDRDDLTVELMLASAMGAGEAWLGIYAWGEDGDPSYQFSLELDDGEIDELSVYEFGKGDSSDLDTDDAEVAGSTVRFTVPRSLGKKLGDQWSWFAFSARGNETIDTCPGTPDEPEFLTFER